MKVLIYRQVGGIFALPSDPEKGQSFLGHIR